MVQLPILPTVGNAYAFVWRERKDFASLAFLAIVVLAILSTIIAWLARSMVPTGAGEGNGTIGPASIAVFGFGGLVLMATYLVLWTTFAVAWHRRYLVLDERATVRTALRWRRRQTRFLLIAIGLAVITTLLGLVGSILSISVFAIGSLLALLAIFALLSLVGLVYARLSLLFPSTAVDHRMSFGDCWEFTRENGWRLLFIIVLVAIPVGVVALLVGLLVAVAVAGFGLSDSLTADFIVALVNQTFVFAGIAVGVSALSIAYRALMAERQVASPAGGGSADVRDSGPTQGS